MKLACKPFHPPAVLLRGVEPRRATFGALLLNPSARAFGVPGWSRTTEAGFVDRLQVPPAETLVPRASIDLAPEPREGSDLASSRTRQSALGRDRACPLRFRRARAVHSESVETCCGIEPHESSFADHFDHQISTSGCSQPESNRRYRVGNAECFRNTLAAESASSADRTRVTGLEDQRLTIRPYSRRAHVRNRTGRPPIPRVATSHRPRAKVEMLGNAPSRPACKARQQPSASIPVAGLEGIEPSFGVLEAPLRAFAQARGAPYRDRTDLTP